MKVYLVGGAVRDRLLGLPVRERDWVVVGALPGDLERAGYRSIGREFPVFLHPDTHEEYALARLERKVAPGYRGFVAQFSPDVTLEEDLRRRDLTINAIAEEADGAIIDPYGGRADLAARLLRHVSDAFVEDPVRILRVARFAARFARLGFTVAPGTLALMQRMVAGGEVAALVPERVWQETDRALGEPDPQVYFETLRACGALAVIFPEVEALFGVPQPPRWHPEIDTGVHTLLALRAAAALSASGTVRFATLVHDLGKARTPPARWPSHPGHEEAGVAPIEALCARLKVPNAHRELALLAAREHTRVHRALELRPETMLELLERCDALRRPERFAELLLACEADARGRTGREREPYPQSGYLRAAHAAAAAVSLAAEERAGLTGEAIGRALRERRLAALTALRRALPGAQADARPAAGAADAPASLTDFAARYTAAWCRHAADAVAAFYAPTGSLAINDAPPAIGRAAIAAAAQGFMSAFPDLVVAFDRLEPRGDRVLYHWTLTGTHTGPGGSGNRVRISGHEDWKLGDDGLIADSRGHFDAADWDRQVRGDGPAGNARPAPQ